MSYHLTQSPINSHKLNINQELLPRTWYTCCTDGQGHSKSLKKVLNQHYSPNTVTEGEISYQVKEQVFWEDHHPIKEEKKEVWQCCEFS